MSIYGPSFPDETFALPVARRGDLAMASSGPDSNGCQFFLALDRARFLDGTAVVFGHLLSGGDALRKIEDAGSPSGATAAPVVIARSGQLAWDAPESAAPAPAPAAEASR